MEDPEYIKQVVRDKDSYLMDSFWPELIVATNDSEYIKQAIKNREELEIDDVVLYKLVIGTKDAQYIKDYLKAVADAEPNSVKLVTADMMIKATEDAEYIKQILEDEEEREKYYLNRDIERIVSLVEKVNEIDGGQYIKGLVDNQEKRKKVGLDVYGLASLVVKTKNEELLKVILAENNNKDFDKTERYILTLAARDTEAISKCIADEVKSGNIVCVDKQIELPESMTIGMEIESEGKSSQTIEKCAETIVPMWKGKPDGSLRDGVEVVSPILTGNTVQSSDDIKRMCTALNMLRANYK